jgi:hypothetical protein
MRIHSTVKAIVKVCLPLASLIAQNPRLIAKENPINITGGVSLNQIFYGAVDFRSIFYGVYWNAWIVKRLE